LHDLRHTAGSALLNKGGSDIRLVQQQLGHSDMDTTAIYAHAAQDRVSTALNVMAENTPWGRRHLARLPTRLPTGPDSDAKPDLRLVVNQ
jgi:hypothetical protein